MPDMTVAENISLADLPVTTRVATRVLRVIAPPA